MNGDFRNPCFIWFSIYSCNSVSVFIFEDRVILKIAEDLLARFTFPVLNRNDCGLLWQKRPTKIREHCVGYTTIWVFLPRLSFMGAECSIRENMGQRKLVFWHILHTGTLLWVFVFGECFTSTDFNKKTEGKQVFLLKLETNFMRTVG